MSHHYRRTRRVRRADWLGPFLLTVPLAVFANPANAQVRPIDLGTLGGLSSAAVAVNGSGQVVGYGQTKDGVYHAISWTSAGGMIDLGTLVGFPSSFGTGVNARGQVIGSISQDEGVPLGVDHAFSWTATGGMIDLGTTNLCCAEAVALNDRGEIAVNAHDARLDEDDYTSRAFLWTAAKGLIALSTTAEWSAATALNTSGRVVGTVGVSANSIMSFHAFSWTAAGGMRDLGTLGGDGSGALAVNASGQVVGWSDAKIDHRQHAFSWTAGTGMIDLGANSGQFTFSQAVAVNNAGQVVGHRTDFQESHAFSWTSAGGLIDLGIDGSSVARAVNASGQVVGSRWRDAVGERAFLWTVAGGMVDLAPLAGFSGSYAVSVNDDGLVVGASFNADGVSRATIWPVGVHAITPIADAYVRGGVWSATNFGSASALFAKKGVSPDNTRRSYLTFNVAGVHTIERATLRLYSHVSSASTPAIQATVYSVPDVTWDERTITWNTRPNLGAVLGSITVDDAAQQWVDIDVTKFVRSERLAGRNVISFALRVLDHTSAALEVQSREAGSTGPQLVIVP